jgi:hypothetical protein
MTGGADDATLRKVCLNSKFPPTLHSTLEIQPTTHKGKERNSYLFNEFVCKMFLFLHEWAS